MKQLLVVDDDPHITQGLSDIIAENLPDLYEVRAADSGVQALTMLNERDADIVVTDIKMPAMDGLELLHILRRYRPDTPVIVLSGYDEYSLIRGALLDGARDYLLKPVNITLFLEMMQRLNVQPGHRAAQTPIPLPEEGDSAALGRGDCFFDVEPEHTCEHQELEELLAQAARAAVALEPDHLDDLLRRFFSGLSPQAGSAQSVRRMLVEFVYSVMEQNTAYIQMIASNKLTDLDILNGVKNLPALSQLRTKFCDLMVYYAQSIMEAGKRGDSYVAQRARREIHEHYREDIKLNDLAKRYQVHPNYLSLLFRAQFNITFREYLRKVRIDRAKELMMDRSVALYDIAFQVGYQDASHFNRAFKEATGISPSHYRKMHV